MINYKDYNLSNSDKFKNNHTTEQLDYFEDYICALNRSILRVVDEALENLPEEMSDKFEALMLRWARLNRLQQEQLMKLFNGPFEQLRRQDPNYHHYDATGRDMIQR
jgi:hypothetical protein